MTERYSLKTYYLIFWEVLSQGNMMPLWWNTFVEVKSCTHWDDKTNCVVIWCCSNTLSQLCSVVAKSNSNHSQMSEA